ncbi:MAG: winged helix DNA-binding domain-containing protein [Candidatus Dormiibacterota bacterium]
MIGHLDGNWETIARRRLRGQLLDGSSLETPEEVVSTLAAMQAQDHGLARWSVAQRLQAEATAATLDRAFDEGRFLRTHLLRPTWHYVAAFDLRWLMRLSGPRVDGLNAGRYRELELDAATLGRANEVLGTAVAGRPRTRHELAEILDAEGISTAGQRLAHLLMHGELTAVICSGPMHGRQHTYAPFDARVPARPGPEGDEAVAELARRYFSTRGPATPRDFAWWSGLGLRDIRRGLALLRAPLTCRTIDGRSYWFVDNGALPPARRRRIDPVQCFDELILSYSETRDVLQTNDVSFPVPRDLDGYRHVLLLDGRLLGHWRTVARERTSIETRVARPLDEAERRALDEAARRYRHFAATPAPPRDDSAAV